MFMVLSSCLANYHFLHRYGARYKPRSLMSRVGALEAKLKTCKTANRPCLGVLHAKALTARVNTLEKKLAAKQCQSGEKTFFPHRMHSYRGVREQSLHVRFARRFSTRPVVTAAISTLDSDHHWNVRVVVRTRHVSTSGFYISVKEWGSTYLYRVIVAWMACSN